MWRRAGEQALGGPLNNPKCWCQRKCSQTAGVFLVTLPWFPGLLLPHQGVQGNASSNLVGGGDGSKKALIRRVKGRGQKQGPFRESSVLAFLFLLKCLYS